MSGQREQVCALEDMRIALIVISVLLLLTGAVWILQGVNILPGSFMTGQIRWAYAGIVTALIGGGLLWVALRSDKARWPSKPRERSSLPGHRIKPEDA